MTIGGDGYRATGAARTVRSGWHHTEEGRRNISIGHMGNKSRLGSTQSVETRNKISAGLKRKEWKPSEKWLAAREAQNGKPRPDLRGRKMSEEQKEKRRQGALRRWAKVPIEERREILSFNREPKTPEHRRKIAESLRGRGAGVPKPEEIKRKIADGLRGFKRGDMSAEHKQKISNGVMAELAARKQASA